MPRGEGLRGEKVYVKLGVLPLLTTLPRPNAMAQAAMSELRYFSIAPAMSQEVLKTCVANSWPLPNSSASLSVLSFGLASAAFSFFSCQTLVAGLAVAMSVCLPLPKPIRISRMFADIFGYLLGRLTLAIALDHQRHQNFGRCLHFSRRASIGRAHPDFLSHH